MRSRQQAGAAARAHSLLGAHHPAGQPRCCLASPVAAAPPAVSKAINEVLDAVREEGAKAKAAAESFAEKHPNGILARVLGKDTEETGTKRRLLTLSTMAERVSERMQVGWGPG